MGFNVFIVYNSIVLNVDLMSLKFLFRLNCVELIISDFDNVEHIPNHLADGKI